MQKDTLAPFQRRMTRVSWRDYAMDFLTKDPTAIRVFLTQNQALANFDLPEPLKKAPIVGYSVRGWHGMNISMLCFRTEKAAATPLENASGTSRQP